MEKWLENNDVILRGVEPEDALFMYECESDSSQWKENGMMAPFTLKNLTDYALSYNPDPFKEGQIRFIIWHKGKEERAGIIDLYDINPSWRTCFVGIYILPSMRRSRLAKNALDIIGVYAANLLGLRRIGAKVSESNIASTGLFEKSGYRLEGRLKDWICCRGVNNDLLIFAKTL